MKERPILFSAEMVRAILAGEKTQTRRPITHRHEWAIEERDGKPWPWHPPYVYAEDDAWMNCPHGVPGDRLWVREAWAPADGRHSVVPIVYRADGDDQPCLDDRWRPSIHMPRWASRLTLEVVSVRVERVNEITEDAACAEGISFQDDSKDAWRGFRSFDGTCLYATAKQAFMQGWDSLYAKTPNAWDSNPWVWCVEFRRVDGESR